MPFYSNDNLAIRVTEFHYCILYMFPFEIKWQISNILLCKDIPHYIYTRNWEMYVYMHTQSI